MARWSRNPRSPPTPVRRPRAITTAGRPGVPSLCRGRPYRSERCLRRRQAEGGRLVAIPRAWVRRLAHASGGEPALATAAGSELRAAGAHAPGSNDRREHANRGPSHGSGGQPHHEKGECPGPLPQERRQRQIARRPVLRQGLFPTLGRQSSRSSPVEQNVAETPLEGKSPLRRDAPRPGDTPQPNVLRLRVSRRLAGSSPTASLRHGPFGAIVAK